MFFNFVFVFFLWLFLVDIDNYYLNYTSQYAKDWPKIVFSVYTKWVEDNIANVLNDINSWYIWTY